jgi:hypothetical protein
MANIQNLKPFPKGKSGNPGGRPKKGIAFEEMMRLVNETPGEMREICKIWLSRIKAGDYQFFREFLDRCDGKPTPMEDVKEEADAEDFGVLVKVPTVKQAEKRQKAKDRKKAARAKKPRKGAADGSKTG